MSSPHPLPPGFPRPAWVEVDLDALARNVRQIRSDLPSHVQLLQVVKDNAYSLGAAKIAHISLENGVDEFATFTVGEAVELRNTGLIAPILLLGERIPEEFPWIKSHRLTPCVGSVETAIALDAYARQQGLAMPVHLKINSGMNRFGFCWRSLDDWAPQLTRCQHLQISGALTHFAQSDELDKTFARQQLANFKQVLAQLHTWGINPKTIHACNSGGFLDLPEAHFDMVRVGILVLGVYPSQVCRRLPKLDPVMSIKARITAIQNLQPGDTVGYGMRFRAESTRRIAVLPLGYGDGFPRVRNEGRALIHGLPAPLVGGVSMDAITVDITDIPHAQCGDEAVVLGRQGTQEVTVHELAALKRSVSYDILAGWRNRLPRIYRGGSQ